MKTHVSLTTGFTATILVIFLIGQLLGLILFWGIYQRVYTVFLYQGILLIAIIVGAMLFLRRNVRKPLKDLRTSINKIAEGDLRAPISHTGVTEIRALTDVLDSFLSQLRNTIHKLHLTMTDTVTAIRQIKSHMDKITDGVNTQFHLEEKAISTLRNAEESQKSATQRSHNISKSSEENASSLIEISSAHDEVSKGIGELSRSLGDICSTMAEMSAMAKETSKNTEDLSTSTAETVASVSEITANLKGVEESTRESARLASDVRRIGSEEGVLRLTDALDDIEKIAESANKSLEFVSRLAQRSRDIEKILSVITDVVKQTNLLGTNAAILAEQAGEYGKGFSVVAGEIKALARKTASSAKEIGEIINSLKREMEEAIHVTELGKAGVEKGKESLLSLAQSFGKVIEAAQKSDKMASQIQKATEEQVRAVTQINSAMEMIQMTVEHLTKNTTEQERGSGHILGIAEKLKDIAEFIKRSMQEQNAALHLISKNLELSNDRVKYIIDASSEYGRFNDELLLAMDKIKTLSHETASVIEEMAHSFDILYQNVETLKKDMEGFRLG